jgi:glycosyltransferase involved in cell wall biosynthesis
METRAALGRGLMADDSLVSVVIPCRNGARTLGGQLAALARQDYAGSWEVVLADNGSTDGSAAIAEAWRERLPDLRIVDAPRPGINVARNAGVRASRGRSVALCDTDDEVGPGWLRGLVDGMAKGEDLVGGCLDLYPMNSRLPPGRRTRRTALADGLSFLPWPEGANIAFSRELFDRLGGFDETFFSGGDEIEFAWRAQLAGYSLGFVPDAVVHYSVRSSAGRVFRQFLGYGSSHAHLYRHFRHHGMPRSRTKLVLGRWLWILAHAPAAILRRGEEREAVVRRAGIALGRMRGSLKHRVLYL